MLDNDSRIESDPIDSMGKLFLQVAITRREVDIYRQVIDANETEYVIQMTGEAAAALDQPLGDVEQALTEHVVRARRWWAKRTGGDPAGDGFRANFVTSAQLAQMDARIKRYDGWRLTTNPERIGPAEGTRLGAHITP
jgi:hypothetical protein